MYSHVFLWYAYLFLCIPVDSYSVLMDAYGHSWIPIDSCGFLLDSYRHDMDLYWTSSSAIPHNSRIISRWCSGPPGGPKDSYGFLLIPLDFNGFLWNPMQPCGIPLKLVELYGILWNPVESCGIQLDPIVFYRILLRPMELFRSYGIYGLLIIHWIPMFSHNVYGPP